MITRNSLTYVQRREIDRFLSGVIKVHPDGVEYINDESDQSVAKRFNCTDNNVATIRRQVYGEIRVVTAGTVEGRLAHLERRVARLEAALASIGRGEQASLDFTGVANG